MSYRVFVFAAAAALAVAAPAFAKPGGGHGKSDEQHGQKADDHGKGQDQSEGKGRAQSGKRLGDREAGIVRDYYAGKKSCPPGLAKKNNGCMPPGLAKKNYEIGSRLSDEVDVRRVPRNLRDLLPSLPDGQGYRYVDGDLGVVDLSTMVLLEALALS
jgi:hypothetical protein